MQNRQIIDFTMTMAALKHGWPFPEMTKPNMNFKIRSSVVVPFVGTCSRILIGWFNKVEAHNQETLRKLVVKSTRNAPLLTVSNHTSCVDDPGLWALLRWRDLWNADRMRWSLAAHDICFTNPFHSWFFSSGKCVPIIRGDGVYQEGMNFCLERLNEGHWVHIFPEGKVNMTLEVMRLKWGVGRLIYESKVTPIVLPFYHVGMETVLPNVEPYVPKLMKEVTIVVGEPMDFTDLLATLRSTQVDAQSARKIITDKIQDEFLSLKEKAEELHRKRIDNR